MFFIGADAQSRLLPEPSLWLGHLLAHQQVCPPPVLRRSALPPPPPQHRLLPHLGPQHLARQEVLGAHAGEGGGQQDGHLRQADLRHGHHVDPGLPGCLGTQQSGERMCLCRGWGQEDVCVGGGGEECVCECVCVCVCVREREADFQAADESFKALF